MNCAQVILEGLTAMGCRRIYGVVGTSNVAFVSTIHDCREAIRYVSCRHEQVAASMADAEGRLTGTPGVAVTHAGPGTANALLSVACAFKDSSPMICLSGAVKRRLQGRDAQLEAHHLHVFGPFCKGVFRIEDAREAGSVLSEAYRLAVSGAKGPVLIEVPEDVWEEEGAEGAPEFRFVTDPKPKVRPGDVRAAVDRLKAAERPVLIAGGGVARSGASDRMVSFAEAVDAPVITTGNGRGTVPETHRLCLGRVGFGGGNTVADMALSRADVVLGVGCRISDLMTYEYTLPVPGEVFLVGIDRKAIEQSRFEARALIEADPGDFLALALGAIEGFKPPCRDAWWDTLRPVQEAWDASLKAAIGSDKIPLSPGRVMHELARILPPDHIVTVGSGMHVMYPMAFLPCVRPLSWLQSVNFGAMGFGFPAALAAGLIHPEKTVVAVLGDGDFMMTLQDLETAVREGLRIRVLIVNDGMYRVLNFRQRMQYQGRVIGTCHGNPDFAALARTFGASGWRLERPEEIRPVLEEALGADGPSVVDVIVDPDDMPPANIEAALKMSR
jgi:acetolactate synthase-1/2/3 large subunit